MKEEKEENKIVEDGPIVINEKDILNPEDVKLEDTIEVEAAEVIIENKTENTEVDRTEVVTSTGETKEAIKGEGEAAQEKKKAAELVAKEVYEDKLLKINVTAGAVIKEVYEQIGVKLTEARKKELIKAGVAELKEI